MREVTARVMRDIQAYLQPSEIEAMTQSCDNLRDRLLIRLLWRTGMRVSELVRPGRNSNPALGLRVSDILWHENALIIKHAKRKGNPPRRIDIDSETLGMLREYLKRRPEKTEFVMPITRQTAWLIIKEAAERTGIEKIGDPLVSKNLHPHPHHLRHSFAIHWIKTVGADAGSVRMLQDQLGHASASQTLQYATFGDEEKRAAYDKLWQEEMK